MIDIQNEKTFSLAEATKLDILPRRRAGRKPAVSTLWRWALHGVRGIRLETIMAGGVRVTSVEAIQRFFDALTDQAENDRSNVQVPQSYRFSATRLNQIEAAERRLAEKFRI
jgi:hypothetical protein